MAINPETQYPGKIAPSTPEYPYGAARNITLPGDGTGTPWEAALVNDLFGFQQALLGASGIAPTGTPDKATASQYRDALYMITGLKRSTLSVAIADASLKAGVAVNLTERSAGKGGSAIWDVKTGSSSNGLDLIPSTGVPGLYLELRKGDLLNAKDFGDIETNAEAIIERMVAAGDAIYLPSGEYDAAALDVFDVGEKVVIFGDTPSYDPVTDTKRGTWLNGVFSATAPAIALFDVGIDTRSVTTQEGVVIADPTTPPDSVFLDRVIVIAKPTSNHCMLIENTRRVDVGTVMLYGGVQGFAIKAEVFNIGAIFAFDQTTWGCTVRYSPGAPCSNGNINYVYCGTVNNAKGGGVICMNDQSGAALKNVGFGRVYIEQGNAGFFVTNGGNATSAENITVDDLFIEGVSDFAIQTFGPPKGVKIKRAHLKDCSGSIFTNSGACEDYEIDNITLENTPAPALLSGANHKCKGWTYKGSSGVPGAFIQNESTDLQVFSMDQRIAAVVNQGGGTTIGGGTPSVKYPANGNLPAMVNFPALKVQKSVSGVATNDLITLYTLPAGSSQYMLRLQVTVFSPAARHSRTVEIAQNDIQFAASSASAGSVFTIEKNGDNIDLKYLFVTTGDVDVNVVIDAFHEDA